MRAEQHKEILGACAEGFAGSSALVISRGAGLALGKETLKRMLGCWVGEGDVKGE